MIRFFHDKLISCQNLLKTKLDDRKLKIIEPYACEVKLYFVSGTNIKCAIVLTDDMGKAGPISQAWGVVFINPDKPKRCTDIFTSHYGESVVLEKLHEYLKAL